MTSSNDDRNAFLSIKEDDIPQRLDRWLKRLMPNVSMVFLHKLIRTGAIRTNGKCVPVGYALCNGDNIRIPQRIYSKSICDKIPDVPRKLNHKDLMYIRNMVIYQDDHFLALNKPPAIAVQEGTKTRKCIDNMLVGLQRENEDRPRLVHRLDRDTSGVLLLARTRKSAAIIGKDFSDRKIMKIYWAAVEGIVTSDFFMMNSIIKANSNQDNQASTFCYRVACNYDNGISWVALYPVTGRKHQIRIHMSQYGHPVLFDCQYGNKKSYPMLGNNNTGIMNLHSRSILFNSLDKNKIAIQAPLHKHMINTWDLCGWQPNDFKEKDFLRCYYDVCIDRPTEE